MNNYESNGPNGWRPYPAPPGNGNGYESSDNYDSDMNASYMNDVDDEDFNLDEMNDVYNQAMAEMANADLQQPNNVFPQPMAYDNSGYVPEGLPAIPRPPPLEAIWNGTNWFYPVPDMPQQQQFVTRAPFPGMQQQYQPIVQPSNVGQGGFGQGSFRPLDPPQGNSSVAQRRPKAKSTRRKAQPKDSRAGKPAKKISLAQRCICKKGRPEHVKRPRNVFMLWKSHQQDNLRRMCVAEGCNLGNFSTYVGGVWATLPEAEKAKYKAMAAEEERQHLLAHPGYKYAPSAKEDALFGTEECTCGAYEANIAYEASKANMQGNNRRQSRAGKSQEHEVNYGIPKPKRKRQPSATELGPTPKRMTRSSRSNQPPPAFDFEPYTQAGQMAP